MNQIEADSGIPLDSINGGKTLAFSWLAAVQPGHTLVTSGVYGAIRHPQLSRAARQLAGLGLAFRSGVGVLLTAFIIPALLARIHAEERLLRSYFGAEYDA